MRRRGMRRTGNVICCGTSRTQKHIEPNLAGASQRLFRNEFVA